VPNNPTRMCESVCSGSMDNRLILFSVTGLIMVKPRRYTTRSNADSRPIVGQHCFQMGSSLLDEQWNGTEGEELESFVSEICYIHRFVSGFSH
jgi:hypothetical protein